MPFNPYRNVFINKSCVIYFYGFTDGFFCLLSTKWPQSAMSFNSFNFEALPVTSSILFQDPFEIKNERLTFSEFLYLVSRHKDENNQPIQRSQEYAMSISSFLQGKTTHTPTMIVECWYQSADASGWASASNSIST